MVATGTVITACKEYPHVDYLPRARELHAILAAAARGGAMPRTALRRVPMLGLFGTTEGPMKAFVHRVQACERQPGILAVSPMHGFPWSDTPDTCAGMLVVSDGDAASARHADVLADQLAAEFFALRASASARRLPIDTALDEALALASAAGGRPGPVVIADGSDNPGGGAASDSTFVLHAMLARGVENAAFGLLWDPQAAAIAAAAGIGARLALRFGGKVGPMSGPPVDATVQVLAVREDGAQRGLDGHAIDPLGLAVAIRVDGIDVVLNSRRQQTFSPDCFSALGIDIAARRLVVVKSSQHFRAGFDPIARATVYCDAPGSLNGDLAQLPYRHLHRPLWPLDAIAQRPG